jgi:TolA-binding protein
LEHTFSSDEARAALVDAISAVRLGKPDGEVLVSDFIRRYAPSADADIAKVEMGNYYFAQKKYDFAIKYYEGVTKGNLDKEAQEQVQFKTAYSYFVRKNFGRAKSGFAGLKSNKQSVYFYPSNYYYGITAFFDSEYDTALSSFNTVSSYPRYSKVVPSYIAQIYFYRKQYQQVIDYSEPLMNKSDIQNKQEIGKLLGQSYFELGKFDKAVTYLTEYSDKTAKLTEKEIYQLAFTQYKTGKFKEAIKNFEQLKSVNSQLGQNSLYILADSYLKTGDKNSARNSFYTASKMNFDKNLQEESAFNFGKLSYELGFDKEAVITLQSFKLGSPYYGDSQSLLAELFLKTRDYQNSLETIESLPNKTPKLQEAYQKLTYYRGVQLYNSGEVKAASTMFEKSIANPLDPSTRALAAYWLGEIAFYNRDYDGAIYRMNDFLSLAKVGTSFPEGSSIHTASYTIGYAYLRKKQYSTAKKYFEQAVEGIKQRFSSVDDSDVRNRVLPDAILRTGDCYFKSNEYPKAKKYYDEVIDGNLDGYDYAMFQKGVILGLEGKDVDKILALEKITNNYPQSQYADDAYYALGQTYFELLKYDPAKKMFASLVSKYPKSELKNLATIKLGLISFNMDDFPKAVDYYKQVMFSNPNDNESKQALAGLEETYIEMGNADGYFDFVSNIPGYDVTTAAKDSIKYKAAYNQYQAGNWDKSIEGFDSYLSAFPNGRRSIEAHFRRGEAYHQIEGFDPALRDYEWVIDKGMSQFYEPSVLRAALISYKVKKDYTKAGDYYTKLADVATDPTTKFEAQQGAMRCAYRTGKTDKVTQFAELVTNSPKSTSQTKGEAQYYLAKVALDAKNYPKALTAFTNVRQLLQNEYSAEAIYQINYITFQQQKIDEAYNLCLQSNAQMAGYEYWQAKNIILVSDIYVIKKDYFNAKASLQSIIDNYDGDKDLLNTARAKLETVKTLEAQNSRVKPASQPTTIEFEGN